MQRDDEDDVWRAIVENYGERPQLDDDPPAPADEPPAAEPPVVEPPVVESPVAERPATPSYDEPAEPSDDLGRADDERFVPPPPPPLPRPVGLRAVAWSGVFGAPAVLLVLTVLAIGLPDLVVYGLVAWFVGGFLYLVWKMPRGPRDPWDNGAKL